MSLADERLLNHLLAALPEDDWLQLLPHLAPVELHRGQVLHEAGMALSHVYFPTTATVSLVSMLEDGGSVEVATVGNEGIVGVCAFMGGISTLSSAVVQTTGQGLRLPAAAIAEAGRRSARLMQQLLRYTLALISQMSQMAACNRHHSVDQQLCRWLLLMLDRVGSDELAATQERIASLLGVRREGVTYGALKLQQAGVIRYSRGRIAVLNRAALEERACECYTVVRNEYARLGAAPTAALA
jgi:CRP-like cAMP-binding protein